ncbi:MAG: 7-cyano-7-deazaguanine synthase QueC [Verrucomicrobia bacterium]|nr:7-cyano-7-deazaguanine synthase QueC [Verrucomicrobiota bacterium]
MKRKIIVLVSGGVDSVCALHDAAANYEVVAGLSFDYGAKHNHREIPFAALHCQRLGVRNEIIRLDFIGQHFRSALLQSGASIPDTHYEAPAMKQTIVPFRNGIFLATAAGFAESVGAKAVVIAAHAGDHAIFPDCRAEFMDAMSQAIGLGTDSGVEIVRPFIGLSKAQIVQRGQALGVNLAETWTCYKGGERHCGTCGACVERREAFSLAGVTDATVYFNCE